MYLIAIIGVVVATVVMTLLTGDGFQMLPAYLDLASIFVLFIFTFPILVSSGLVKDFNHAFKLVMNKEKETNITEIKRAIEAVSLVIKVLLLAGAFIFIFTIILILADMDDLSLLGPKIAVAAITLLYAVGVDLFLLPLRARLKIKMMEYMQKE